MLTWELDGFAHADSYDEAAERYRGLRAGEVVSLPDAFGPGLLVQPGVARRQLDADRAQEQLRGGSQGIPDGAVGTTDVGSEPSVGKSGAAVIQPYTRFHGTVRLDATRLGADAGRIGEEVIAHLAGLEGAKVTVTLEVSAEIPSGAPDKVVRTVTENASTLKFANHGFERE